MIGRFILKSYKKSLTYSSYFYNHKVRSVSRKWKVLWTNSGSLLKCMMFETRWLSGSDFKMNVLIVSCFTFQSSWHCLRSWQYAVRINLMQVEVWSAKSKCWIKEPKVLFLLVSKQAFNFQECLGVLWSSVYSWLTIPLHALKPGVHCMILAVCDKRHTRRGEKLKP